MPKDFPLFPAVDGALKEVRSSFFAGGDRLRASSAPPFTEHELEVASRFDAAAELKKARLARARMGLDQTAAADD